MPVIKQPQVGSAARDAVVLDLGDVGRQAAALINAAKQRAVKIIEGANEEAKRLTANAHDHGFQQGLGDGHAEGLKQGSEEGRAAAFAEAQARLQAIEQAWVQAAVQWDAGRQTLDVEARQDVLTFALNLIEKVIHRTLQYDDQLVTRQLGEALSLVLSITDVQVRISPDDRPVLDEALPNLMRQFPRVKHVQLVDDPSVSRGGCRLTYGQGEIDARVESQLEQLAALFQPGDAQGVGPVKATDAASMQPNAAAPTEIQDGAAVADGPAADTKLDSHTGTNTDVNTDTDTDAAADVDRKVDQDTDAGAADGEDADQAPDQS